MAMPFPTASAAGVKLKLSGPPFAAAATALFGSMWTWRVGPVGAIRRSHGDGRWWPVMAGDGWCGYDPIWSIWSIWSMDSIGFRSLAMAMMAMSRYGCESKYKAPIHTLNPQDDPYPRSIPKRRWSRPFHTSGSPRADPYPNFDATPYVFVFESHHPSRQLCGAVGATRCFFLGGNHSEITIVVQYLCCWSFPIYSSFLISPNCPNYL